MVDEMREFNVFLAPHGEDYLITVKRNNELCVINKKFNMLLMKRKNEKKTEKKVTFDVVPVQYYFKTN